MDTHNIKKDIRKGQVGNATWLSLAAGVVASMRKKRADAATKTKRAASAAKAAKNRQLTAHLTAQTAKALKAEAVKQGISGATRMNKSALVKALKVGGKFSSRAFVPLAVGIAAYEVGSGAYRGYKKGGAKGAAKGALVGAADFATFGATSAAIAATSPKPSKRGLNADQRAQLRGVSKKIKSNRAQATAGKPPGPDGFVDPHTRRVNGKTVQVTGHKRELNPARMAKALAR